MTDRPAQDCQKNLEARMQQNASSRPGTVWAVLRCEPARTLPLARKLSEAGAWTPTYTRQVRVPRKNVRRQITQAHIPSFVFLPFAALEDLVEIPGLPFRAMRMEGRLVRVMDGELQPLRDIADRAPVPDRRLPKAGATLRFSYGPFGGLRATVVSCTPHRAFISLEGIDKPVEVAPCLILENEE